MTGNVEKSFLPYKYMDSLAKLSEESLPPYEAFFSSIKQDNTLNENKVRDTWTILFQ